MSKQLHIGLIGCGKWGRYILKDLVDLGCEVSVVARSPESIERAKRGGAYQIVDSIDLLPDLSGYVLASLTSTHAELLDKLLDRAGLIFCEKPVTDHLPDAVALLPRAEGRVFLMDKWRYHAGTVRLGEMVTDGILGTVLGVKSVRTQWGNPHPDVDAPWTYLPHELAIAKTVLGAIPPPQYAVQEEVNGRPAGIYAILGRSPWFISEFSTSSVNRSRQVQVFGSDAVALLNDPYADHILVRNRTGEILDERHEVSTEMPLRVEIEVFLKHLAGGPPPLGTFAEAVEDVRVIQSIITMARSS
jgi:predicted dehydrogenase